MCVERVEDFCYDFAAIVIGFEQSWYQVEVGESDVNLTIGVNVTHGQLRRDIQVHVYTESDTALGQFSIASHSAYNELSISCTG